MTTPYDPYRPPAAAPGASEAAATAASQSVPPAVVALLSQTRPWVKLIALLIFAGQGLLLVGSLFVWAVRRGGQAAGESAWAMVPLVLMMLLYVPAAVLLWNYAGNIRQLQRGGGQAALEAALGSQKTFWKYVGILAVVTILLYGVFIFGAITLGVFSGISKRGG